MTIAQSVDVYKNLRGTMNIKHIEVFECVESTMDIAERYVQESRYDDHFLILAETQSKGKGRKGNFWVSPKGGLWFSLGMNHISRQQAFTLFIGYCVLKSLSELTNTCAYKIKWPNDIYMENKKICGLYCSQYVQHHKTIVGIGINTNVSDTPFGVLLNADSISNLLGITIQNDIYLEAIVNRIFDNLDVFEDKGILLFSDCYHEHDFLKDKNIQVVTDKDTVSGLYQGINKDGALILKNQASDIQYIYAGSIEIME